MANKEVRTAYGIGINSQNTRFRNTRTGHQFLRTNRRNFTNQVRKSWLYYGKSNQGAYFTSGRLVDAKSTRAIRSGYRRLARLAKQGKGYINLTKRGLIRGGTKSKRLGARLFNSGADRFAGKRFRVVGAHATTGHRGG